MHRNQNIESSSDTHLKLTLSSFTQIVLALLGIYWLFRSPPPGYSVTILALGAAAMSINEKIGPRKKAVWLLLLALFAQIELRAITKDRKDQDNHFLTTISTITGGDSFAFMSLRPLGIESQTHPFLVQRGINPLHDVKVQIVRISINGKPAPLTILLAPRDIAVGERNSLLEDPVEITGQHLEYMIYYDALNGHWAQQESLRFMNGKWLEALRVIRPNDPSGATARSTVLFEVVDPGFPTVNGQYTWTPFD
jgi:hypothetical protein